MSSSKKKKITVECINCGCFILSKDMTRHEVGCGSAANLSEVGLLRPNEVLIGFEQKVERWESYIAPEVYGWAKRNSVLINPETMSQLGVSPRQPCIYQKSESKRIVLAWPCETVSQLRICTGDKTVTGLIQLFPVNAVSEINNLCLRPSGLSHSFYDTAHFRDYVATYLSGSYGLVGEIIQIPFYGVLCEFLIEQSLTEHISNMTVRDRHDVVLKLAPTIAISIARIEIGPQKKRLSFDDFGGNKKAKDNFLKHLITPVKRGYAGPSVILSGISGTGKSLMLKILAVELASTACFYRNDEDFDDQAICLKGPSVRVFLIDHIDQGDNSERASLTKKLLRFMDENENVSVVLAVQDIEKLDISLRRRFPLEIELAVPSLYERLEILNIIFRNHKNIEPDIILDIARHTHGFTGSDLRCLYRLAGVFEFNGEETDIKLRLTEARKQIRPTGIREIMLEVPNVRWEDIGGYDKLKDEINQAVVWPQQFPEYFLRFNIPAPSGILLYGPPGCSKTMVARALASQSKLNFLAVKGPEIFSKWVGESERAVRELFRRARQVAPSILFFDEIDAVAVSRGEKSGSGVGDRVLAQLLTELDGLEKNLGVVVLAATNRPDLLDGAILRPGRLDKTIYVSLPDEDARKSILLLQSRNVKMHESVDLDEISKRTQGYSGAEVVAVYRNAALIALQENTNAKILRRDHFISSLEKIVPRTEKWMLELYEKFQKGYCV